MINMSCENSDASLRYNRNSQELKMFEEMSLHFRHPVPFDGSFDSFAFLSDEVNDFRKTTIYYDDFEEGDML
jgi:hypothetical protein